MLGYVYVRKRGTESGWPEKVTFKLRAKTTPLLLRLI